MLASFFIIAIFKVYVFVTGRKTISESLDLVMPTSSMQKESSSARGGSAGAAAAAAAQSIPESWPREFLGNSSSGATALLFTKVTLESLFFAFYYQPNTPFKAAAITELHNRGWRYHTQHKVVVLVIVSSPLLFLRGHRQTEFVLDLIFSSCICVLCSCGSSA